MRKIEKLETETSTKQNTLDQLRREKVQLENTLEQEQEGGKIKLIQGVPPELLLFNF